MKCEDLLRMLNDFVDEDIDESVCRQFQEHLDECNPCRVVIDNIRNTITLYKDDAVFELPVECREKLHEMLRRKWNEKSEE